MAASASRFRDLELLLDHNLTLCSSASAFPSPSPSPSSPLPPPPSPPSAPSLPSHHCHHLPPPTDFLPNPSFASLSLAFSPILSPPLLSNLSHSTKPRSLPPPPSPPSQKKCISPSPLMPAVSAAAAGLDYALAIPSSATRKTSKCTTAFPDYQRLPEKRNDFGEPGNGAAMRRASIVWFRSDLRIHDNEALLTASKESSSVLPVFIFDPRDYGKSSSGFDKTGPYRAKFLLECVSNLRDNLRERGSELVVRVGKPEDILISLAKSIGADALYAHQEISCEEFQCESRVSAALQREGVNVKYFWGSTLFHMDDLPFKLERMPITYSGFREVVQKVNIRNTIDPPKQLKGLPARGGVKPGDIPTLQELGIKASSSQRQEGQTVAPSPLIGGETEALRRLKSFSSDHIKQSGNKVGNVGCGESLYGSNFSCKISPWLATGCLSPRHMFEELKSDEKSTISTSASMRSESSDNGLNWLMFELLWRDFFRFITKKYSTSKQGTEIITAAPNTSAVPV